MLLLEPNETALDLRWRMFGIPVRVHPMFWFVTLLMGNSALQEGAQYLLIWVACVFVSILVHELGHVVMGMAFGSRGYIVLYGFGGLAVGSNQLASRGQRVAVSLAGPAAGFLFLGAVFVALRMRGAGVFQAYVEVAKNGLGLSTTEDVLQALLPLHVIGEHALLFEVISQLIFINLTWGLVNLLPVWPLDGGQVSREVFDALAPGRGLNVSLGLSFLVAGVFALHCGMAAYDRPLLPLNIGSTYPAIMFGLLALQSFQMLQQLQAEQRWQDDRWDQGDER